MDFLSLIILSFSAISFASPVSKRQLQSFVFDGDAPFSVDAATLAASLTCPYGNPTSKAPPVLLVHGTTSTGAATWGQGYVPALYADGFTPCYVDLPGNAMGDMQISSEYIAYSIHQISSLSGGLQTAIVGHSQGNPDTQWALKYWPSTRAVTSSFVALAPDFSGIELFDSPLSGACKGDDLCQASLWQQSLGSNYYKALRGDDFSALVPTSVVWSQFDGIVIPASDNAQLPSATVIQVQKLCFLRPVTHITITIDAAAYAIAIDALRNGGSADLNRVKKNAWSSCLQIANKNMKVTVNGLLSSSFESVINGVLLGPGRTTEEPPIMAYAAGGSS